MLYSIISAILAIEAGYAGLMLFAVLRINKYQGYNSEQYLFKLIAFLRLILSKMLFLPILEILTFPISCAFYKVIEPEVASSGSFEGYRSCFTQKLPCFLSGFSDMNIVEKNLMVLTICCFVFHTVMGVFSEAFDYEVSLRSSSSPPK